MKTIVVNERQYQKLKNIGELFDYNPFNRT